LGFDAHEEEQSRLLREALKRADITPGDLWLNYFSIGGAVGEYEVQAYLQGLLSLPPLQRDLLACAANELIDDLPPLPRAPYMEDLRGHNVNMQPEGQHGWHDQPTGDQQTSDQRADSEQEGSEQENLAEQQESLQDDGQSESRQGNFRLESDSQEGKDLDSP